jgi:hypothetical protein
MTKEQKRLEDDKILMDVFAAFSNSRLFQNIPKDIVQMMAEIALAAFQPFIKASNRTAELSIETNLQSMDTFSCLEKRLEKTKNTLRDVMIQTELDLRSAHAEIVKLQGGDPAKLDWPEWSSQANTIRWFAKLRREFCITTTQGGAPMAEGTLQEVERQSP